MRNEEEQDGDRIAKGLPMTPDQFVSQFGGLPRQMKVFTCHPDEQGDKDLKKRRNPVRPNGAPMDKINPGHLGQLVSGSEDDEESSEEWL